MVSNNWSENLRALRRVAIVELRELDAQREHLQALIAFADSETGEGRKPARKRSRGARDPSASILESVRAHPGLRASMLAQLLGKPFDEVSQELAKHEEKGLIKRCGLGWESVDT